MKKTRKQKYKNDCRKVVVLILLGIAIFAIPYGLSNGTGIDMDPWHCICYMGGVIYCILFLYANIRPFIMKWIVEK